MNRAPCKYKDPSGHCVVGYSGEVRMGQYPYGTSGICPNTHSWIEEGNAAVSEWHRNPVYSGSADLEFALVVTGVVFGGAVAYDILVGGATAACADGDCTNEVTSGAQVIEKGLDAIGRASLEGYESFGAFKNAMGRAGSGNAWHHIVGQLTSNLKQFGSNLINNPLNLIKLPDSAGQIHRQITGFYNSIQPQITGSNTMLVRDWLSTQSLEFQWQFGMEKLMEFGGEQYIIDWWNSMMQLIQAAEQSGG